MSDSFLYDDIRKINQSYKIGIPSGGIPSGGIPSGVRYTPGSSSEEEKLRKLEQKIYLEEQKAKEANIDLPETKEKFRVWDILEIARYPVTNMLYTVASEAKGDGLGWDDVGKILKSAVYGSKIVRDDKEIKTWRVNTEDVLKIMFPDLKPWAYTVFGLAGDILTDPATYLTFGYAGTVKGAAAAKKATTFAISAKGKITRQIAKGVESTLAKKIIAKTGAKTWQDGLKIMAKGIKEAAGGYGVKLGIPFTGKGLPIAKGSRTELLSKLVGKFAGEGAEKAVKRLPVAAGKLPIIKGLREAFSTSARIGEEARDVQKVASSAMSWRKEVLDDTFKSFSDDIGNYLKTTGRSSTMKEKSKVLDTIREAIENKTSVVPELRNIKNNLDEMLNTVWNGLRERGIEGKFIPNYFPRYYVKKATEEFATVKVMKNSVDASFRKARKFSKLSDARKAGFDPLDPFVCLSTYTDRANKIITSHDLAKDMVDKFGAKIKSGVVIADDFARVKVGGFTDYILPKEIANAVNEANDILINPDVMSKAVKYFDKLHNFWKKQATIFRLGFHSRNAGSNIWTGIYKDGMGPRQFENAISSVKIFKGKNSKKTISVIIDGKREVKNISELYEQARKLDVHTGGWGRLQLMGEADKPLLTKGVKKAAEVAQKPFTEAGSFVENTARIQSWLNDLGKGFSPEEAAKRVRKYFIDYSDLTKTEQKIKRFVPFYSWLRKNLANQFQFILEDPGKYSMFTVKPLRALDKLPEGQKEWLPDWMKEGMYINLPGMKTATGKPIMFQPDFPFQDVGKIDLKRPIHSLIEMGKESLTPLVKTPIELISNKSWFTDKPIAYGEFDVEPLPLILEKTVSIFPEAVKQKLGIIRGKDGRWQAPSRWVHALLSLMPLTKTFEPISGAVGTITAGEEMPEYQRERALFRAPSTVGIGLKPFDSEYYKMKALQERLKELKDKNIIYGTQ